MTLTFVPQPGPKPTLLQRIFDATGVSKAVRAIVGRADMAVGYFSPGNPPTPQAPDTYRPRQEDYRVGSNINIQPRQDEAVSFWDLYALAENDNITRLLIETRKDQIAALQWDITPREEDEGEEVTPEQEARIKACVDFLVSPDGEHNFDEWIRMLLEDVLVYDAPCVYVDTDNPMRTYFKIVAGMTITRKIDMEGRTPEAPEPAYQQIIHGTVAAEYSSDEMIYKPRNLRPNRIYGMSPVQQIILTVNLALRKQQSQLYYFSEGTIPDALISVPKEWTPKQIADFQQHWDDMLAGNLQQRRHAQFVPGGASIEMTKPAVLTDAADIWFTKIRCFAFSVPHTAFDGNVTRATAHVAKAAANEEGLAPLMQWAKGFIDVCLQKHLGQHDLEFVWVQDNAVDPNDQIVMLDTQLRSGSITLNEYRDQMGRDSYGPDGDLPMIYTGTGPVLLKNIINPPAPGEPGGPPLPLAPPGGPPQQQGKQPPGGKKPPPAKGGAGNGAAGNGSGAAAKKPVPGGREAAKDKGTRLAPSQGLAKDVRKTLYVNRPLINTDDFVEWAVSQGFASVLAPHDLHVTVAFSRAPVDWDMAGAAPGVLRVSTGIRSVEALGDKGAMVLKFTSLQLTNRWRQFEDIGCSWDHPSYQPHITITYQGSDIDLDAVEPYLGVLEFGPEEFGEVVDDWEQNVKEMPIAEVGKAADLPFAGDLPSNDTIGIEKVRPPLPKVPGKRFPAPPTNTKVVRKAQAAIEAETLIVFKALAKDVAGQIRGYKQKLAKYNPDQPRDERGRWGEGGSDTAHDQPSDEKEGSNMAAKWAQEGKDDGLVSTMSANDPNAGTVVYHGTIVGHKDAGFLFVTTNQAGAAFHGQVTAYTIKEGAKLYPDLESGKSFTGYDTLFEPEGGKGSSSGIIHISDLVPVGKEKIQKATTDPDLADLDAYVTVDVSQLETLATTKLPQQTSAVYTAAGLSTLAIVGATAGEGVVNEFNTRAMQWADDRGAEMVGMKWVNGELVDNPNPKWSISQSTRDMLNQTIYDGLDNGLGVDGLADAIQAMPGDDETMGPFSAFRARMISRSETLNAHGKGALGGLYQAQDTGVNVQKEWYADEEACDICIENQDAGPIDLDDTFPSGDDSPTAHPNCECTLIAYLPDEEGGDSGDEDEIEDAMRASLLKYNPDQPRDERGRWGEGGFSRTQIDSAENSVNSNVFKDSGLTFNQQDTLEHYVLGGDYGAINQSLRDGDNGYHDTVGKLDAIISQGTVQQDMTVFRVGESFDSSQWAGAVGKDVTFAGYTSTSMSKDVEGWFPAATQPTLYQISVPKGSNAINIGHVSEGGIDNAEHEVLLPRGSTFTVDRVDASSRQVFLRLK